MMAEKRLWKLLRQNIKRRFSYTESHIERIENAIGSGNPDVNYLLLDVEGWIELKDAESPKRDSSIIFTRGTIRDSQHIWHERRAQTKYRHHFFLLRSGQNVYLIHGRHHDRIEGQTHDTLIKLSLWFGKLPKVNWESLFYELQSKSRLPNMLRKRGTRSPRGNESE